MDDQALALSVARHKAIFFSEKDARGKQVDYEEAVSGGLQLVPTGPARDALEKDYDRMSTDGMLLDEREPFDTLMKRCADLETRANRMEGRMTALSLELGQLALVRQAAI